MNKPGSGRIVRWLERGLAALGATCLVWVGATSLSMIAYQAQKSALLDTTFPPGAGVEAARKPVGDEPPSATAGPIGRLEIPRLGLSAVVVEGDDEDTLKHAVGHLPDTPLPWQEGNAALAGHRDTFFRPLGRIQVGDEIQLATRYGTLRYRVMGHIVVEPDELWVLDPSPAAALTLITCHPFDFIGRAPRRFVVHAERITVPG